MCRGSPSSSLIFVRWRAGQTNKTDTDGRHGVQMLRRFKRLMTLWAEKTKSRVRNLKMIEGVMLSLYNKGLSLNTMTMCTLNVQTWECDSEKVTKKKLTETNV